MTNTPITNASTKQIRIEYTDGAPLAADDPRGAMARAVQAARAVLAQVDADNAANPTPCSEWTALELAQHIVAVLDRAAAGPTDRDVPSMPLLADVPLDRLDEAALAAAERIHANWTDDSILDRPIVVPWGEFPGAVVIGVYAGETIVHAWDLAVAIGVDLDWPEADVAVHFEMSKAGIPEDGRGPEMPFDPVFRPGDDAPLIHHLVGWQGREVDRWIAAR
ncbi:TIGR03086 family metal-binding protein [Ilumatobacter coccineus]|nr:TIGR03086 family metal-binding protein [Ilumatobacter coccineus]